MFWTVFELLERFLNFWRVSYYHSIFTGFLTFWPFFERFEPVLNVLARFWTFAYGEGLKLMVSRDLRPSPIHRTKTSNMGNCTPKSPCAKPGLKNDVWYLEGYYTESGEPILPEPLEPEYVPRKEARAIEWPADGDLEKPSLSPRSPQRFTGKLAPLKLF